MGKFGLVMMAAAIAMAVMPVSAKSPKKNSKKKPAATVETVEKRSIGPNEEIILRADMMPQFGKNGSVIEFRDWVMRRIKVPKTTISKIRKAKQPLQVNVLFVVSKEGYVCNVESSLGKGVALDDEDLKREIERVMYMSPKWVPAVQDGRNVNVRYMMPIHFKPW